MDLFERFVPLVGPTPGHGAAIVAMPPGSRLTVDTEGASRVFVAEGIYYEADPSLEESTGNEAVVGPLPPGEHVLHFENDTEDRPKPTWGWPGDDPGDLVVLVEEGAVTVAGIECWRPPPEVPAQRS